MIYHNEHISKEEKKDRIKSMGITLLLGLLFLLFLYFYKVVKVKHDEEKNITITMVVNFDSGVNSKPALENNSKSEDAPSQAQVSVPIPAPEEKISVTKPQKVEKKVVSEDKEKLITGKNPQYKVEEKNSKLDKVKSNASVSKKDSKNALTNGKNISTSDKSRQLGNTAIGNLLKGKGKSKGSGASSGNGDDPLASGTGSGRVGTGAGDRKLIQFIPGTMGRGGVQPTHHCQAKGTIKIAYTVDKLGNVISAYYASGISDPCAVSTSVSWVKKYVKAEKSTGSSTGVYTIIF